MCYTCQQCFACVLCSCGQVLWCEQVWSASRPLSALTAEQRIIQILVCHGVKYLRLEKAKPRMRNCRDQISFLNNFVFLFIMPNSKITIWFIFQPPPSSVSFLAPSLFPSWATSRLWSWATFGPVQSAHGDWSHKPPNLETRVSPPRRLSLSTSPSYRLLLLVPPLQPFSARCLRMTDGADPAICGSVVLCSVPVLLSTPL